MLEKLRDFEAIVVFENIQVLIEFIISNSFKGSYETTNQEPLTVGLQSGLLDILDSPVNLPVTRSKTNSRLDTDDTISLSRVDYATISLGTKGKANEVCTDR